MTSTTSFINNEVVAGEVEYPANDPASGAFFQPDYKKNEDLKQMLDGSKDSLKLEAMKRIIGMIAKGRDASDLFPAVVKNVVSKNIEVKKLVYVYLVRYAEEQQDLALLSISTFQRALKDPNQLIRASALRVLSSIRVTMIVPIVMLAIRDSASDMSPYVRKTAAHAIPKLYSLDPEQKEELVSIIDKLLSDKAPLVVGSAAMAFTEVCPDRISLIHKSYRKLCSLLADVDEWGQLALLNVLTVYAKTCFPDPNEEEYSSDSNSNSDNSLSGTSTVDAELRLLLRAARPLLQSRNSGVVCAVAQLFYHCGPAQELPPVAKALIRLLRAPIEVQSVILNAIASITVTKRALFEPFLKSFFVRTSDPTHIKLLKLEILTNLATEASAGVVLREFQTYVTSNDKTFAAHTIQAIGRLAVAIATETETCLNGLLHLLSSKDEWVVCEAVVVVKRVVGGGAASATAAVARASRLLLADRLAGQARAAALWLVAEHGAQHPRAAAILAHTARSFPAQDELVKLQLLSLSVKLSLTQPDTLPVCRYVMSLARYDASYDVRDRARLLRRFIEPDPTDELVKLQLLSLSVKLSLTQPDTLPVCRYVMSLARYDASYDVRDRARLLRRFIEPAEGSQLAAHAQSIFRPDKPKPTVESTYKDRQQLTVGSLSQYMGTPAGGYRPLPAAPRRALYAAERNVLDAAPPPPERTKNKNFYSEPESSGSGSGSSSSSGSESSDEEESGSEEEESTNEEKKQEKPAKQTNNYKSSNSESSDSESDSDESSGSESDSGSEESSDESTHENTDSKKPNDTKQEDKKTDKSNLELLLELDEVANTLPTMTPTCGGFLSPQNAGVGPTDDETITSVSPAYKPPSTQLISRVSWRGLGAASQWTRGPHLYCGKMCALELTFKNDSPDDVTDIRVVKKNLSGSRSVHEFPPISSLPAGATANVTLGLDFADSIQPVDLTLGCSLGEVSVSITPPVGELIRAVSMSETRWNAEQKKLRGMTECDKKAARLEDEATICKRVLETANLGIITPTGDILRFAGKMVSSQELVLVSVKLESENARVTANCSNMAIASLLANEIAQAFAKTN